MKVKALLSVLSRSLFKVLEVKMSRLLLSSVLVALVAGLTLLACVVPLEPAMMPEIGDEYQVTEGTTSYYDPCWYSSMEYLNMPAEEVVYHDGSQVYLHFLVDDSVKTLYTAPDGFTIASVDKVNQYDLVVSMNYSSLHLVSYLYVDEVSFECTYHELYRDDNTSAIVSVSGEGSIYGGKTSFYLSVERDDGNLHYLHILNEEIRYGLFTEGYDMSRNYHPYFVFVRGEAPYNEVLCGKYSFVDGEVIANIRSLLDPDPHGNNYYRYPDDAEYVVTVVDGEPDIYTYTSRRHTKLTDKIGFEKELDATWNYIVFSREVDGISNIHILRVGR